MTRSVTQRASDGSVTWRARLARQRSLLPCAPGLAGFSTGNTRQDEKSQKTEGANQVGKPRVSPHTLTLAAILANAVAPEAIVDRAPNIRPLRRNAGIMGRSAWPVE